MSAFLYHALLKQALVWAAVGLVVSALALGLLFRGLDLTFAEYVSWVLGTTVVAGALGAFYERFRFRE